MTTIGTHSTCSPVMRSANPSAAPCRVSTTVHANKPKDATTAAAVHQRPTAATTPGWLAATAGHAARVIAPIAVKNWWAPLVPCTGSGNAATPIAAMPASARPARAGRSSSVRTRVAIRYRTPTRYNPVVTIHRSVPAWPDNWLTVWRIGL
jgi:hypothetical protein